MLTKKLLSFLKGFNTMNNIFSKIEQFINSDNITYFSIYDGENHIYTVKLNNKIIIQTVFSGRRYIITKNTFFSLLIKLHIESIDVNKYIIDCGYSNQSAIIIQRTWKKYIKKKLWNRVGRKLLDIISPHLGNPELPGVRKRLLLEFKDL